MCSQPFAGELFRLDYLIGGHQLCHDITIPDGFGISFIRRQAEAQMRLHIVHLKSDCALIAGKL